MEKQFAKQIKYGYLYCIIYSQQKKKKKSENVHQTVNNDYYLRTVGFWKAVTFFVHL